MLQQVQRLLPVTRGDVLRVECDACRGAPASEMHARVCWLLARTRRDVGGKQARESGRGRLVGRSPVTYLVSNGIKDWDSSELSACPTA